MRRTIRRLRCFVFARFSQNSRPAVQCLRRTIAVALALLIVGGATWQIGASPAGAQGGMGQGQGQGQGPEGSWWIDVTFDGRPGLTNSHLATFGRRGTFIQSAALHSTGNNSSGHGSWERVDDNYALTFQAFGSDDSGDPIIVKISATIMLEESGQRFSAPYRGSIMLPDGTVVQTYSGTAQGRRLLVEPL